MTAPRPSGLLDRATVLLALAGGLVVLAFAAIVTVSVVGRWLVGAGVPGDFELVQTGLAVAIFAFLPICQLHGANILVDTFTTRAPMAIQASLDALWSIAYAGVALLIGWQTVIGARETVASGTRSMVLGLPIGWAMALSAILAFWLGVVALITARRALRRISA
jgi:TRAP-type C4-dicarboxylate transport system permease small subunit